MKISLITGINGEDGSYLDELLGYSSKARSELGWKPKYSFDELIKVEEDCK